jgi:hypothetical protein
MHIPGNLSVRNTPAKHSAFLAAQTKQAFTIGCHRQFVQSWPTFV